jgi:Chaperone of endosialidase
MSSKRKLRSAGSTSDQSLDSSKTYKYNSSGALVEATSIADTDITFSGSKSNLRRIADLERNVSILAAKALTDDGEGTGESGSVDYAKTTGKWAYARTLSLTGDVTGSASIDGSGNVSLSTTVASNTVALGTDTTGNYMVNVSAGTGISVSHTQGEGSTATITNSLSTSGGSIGGAIAVTGAITATGEVTAYYSDLRLKTNIVPIADALEKVEALNGVTFDPNETALALGIDNTHQMGVIAQEVEAVAPELVVDSAFAGFKTVKYDKLTALLIEAVKELSAKVKTLEAQLGNTKPTL